MAAIFSLFPSASRRRRLRIEITSRDESSFVAHTPAPRSHDVRDVTRRDTTHAPRESSPRRAVRPFLCPRTPPSTLPTSAWSLLLCTTTSPVSSREWRRVAPARVTTRRRADVLPRQRPAIATASPLRRVHERAYVAIFFAEL